MKTKQLSRGRAPNYMISMPCEVQYRGNSVTMPAGTFVRPIEDKYVPSHVFDNPKNKYYNSDTHVMVYCWYGIVPVPKLLVIEEY